MQNARPIKFIRADLTDKIIRGKSISIAAGVTVTTCIFINCEIIENAGQLVKCVSIDRELADIIKDLDEKAKQAIAGLVGSTRGIKV